MRKKERKKIKLPLPNIESRAHKYGYSNARVKAMKGLLLSSSMIEEMIKVHSLSGMMELLQRTPYREELTRLAIKYKDTQLIELATQRRFIKIAQKILRMAPDEDKVVVEALLKKWDLLMLRMILNARRAGKKLEDIQPYIIPISPEHRKDFEMLASAEDVFGTFRRTPFGREVMQTTFSVHPMLLRKFRKAIEGGDMLMQLQLMLEAYMYAYMNQALEGTGDRDVKRIRTILRKEIDVRNIVMIEKLKQKGTPKENIQEYLLRGGTFFKARLDKFIQSKNLAETQGLIRSHLGKVSIEQQSLSELEIALEKMLAREKVKAFHRSILSIGTLLGMLLILEEEVHNIRKIAKAKEFGLSEEEVYKTLVVL